jgi:hypothetical protein
VAGYFGIASRPERTVEMMCFSDVLSGHGSNTAIPATLWLANIPLSLRDRKDFYRAKIRHLSDTARPEIRLGCVHEAFMEVS